MLIDTNFTIAYRCPTCGSLKYICASFFDLPIELFDKPADCCKCEIKADKMKKGFYEIMVPCIGCGERHRVSISMREILRRGLDYFICENTGIQYCYIGKDDYVRSMVDIYDKELDGIADCLGYDNYFKNSHVMLDTLIKLHEIAEQGNLFCECGSADIDISLLSDRICLKCRNCPGEKVIYASSNKDLRDILLKKRMLLSRHFDRSL